ncbi:MAG: S8 family serine peptidase [Clostridiales bacterium]
MKKFKLLLCFLTTLIILSVPLGVLGASDNQKGSGIWVVKFKDTVSTSALSAEVKTVESKNNGELEPLTTTNSDYYTTKNPQIAEDMANSDAVEYVEESGYSYASLIPNDTFFAPTVTNAAPSTYQYAYDVLETSGIWDKTKGSKDVNIVVIDSGFTYDHEDGANIKPGKDYVTNGINDYDCSVHGTACAGIIGATFNNSMGIAGAAPDCNVTMLRCFKIVGNDVRGENDAIAAAIRDAVDIYHAKVISMSFGTQQNNKFLEEAVKYAYSKGVIMVAATGNTGDKIGLERNAVEYPASYNQVIGVGSVDREKNISSFSTQNKSTYVSAPGSSILSLSNPDKNNGNLYKSMNGTSLATPYVSSLAALALSIDPTMTSAEFRGILRSSSEDRGTKGYDYGYGYGVINYNNFFKVMSEKFLDVPDGEWYALSVYSLKDQGIIDGKSKYLFDPNGKVTRGEFVKILAKASQEDTASYKGTTSFIDVPVNEWYTEYVNWGVKNEIVKGFGNNLFKPEDPIQREEMAAMISRYVKSKNITLTKVTEKVIFKDDKNISDWARDDIYLLNESGVITGDTEGTFRPQDSTIRAETAAMIDRFLKNN